jgi:hypothetical protein
MPDARLSAIQRQRRAARARHRGGAAGRRAAPLP